MTVDAVAPAAPTVDPSNGVTLSGTAEVGSLVTIVAGNGVVIGQTVTDTAGNWSLAPATPVADGTAIGITASDAVGNTSPAATLTIDATAPAAPTITPGNGIIISGTAEANSLVTLVDGTGAPIGQVVADAGGAWSLTPAAPLADGSAVIARATDAAGNVSTPAASLIDAVAPATPVASPSNGTVLTGTSEAGATITLTDVNGAPVGTTIVAADGSWTLTPATPLADGAIVTVTASDAAGNASPGTSVIIDAVPPAAPVIAPSNGTVFVGTAEPASTVTLTAPGLTIGRAVVDANGNWTITGPAGLANATIVTATATDAAGNVGLPGSVAIDTSLPSIPVIDPTNGAVVAGTADAGDTVTVTDGIGTVIGQTVADAGGNWSITPVAPLTDGTLIQATAQNPFGAVSAPATGIVDGIAPAAPSIDPTNGTEVSGLAEAGATITLTDANGATIGTTTAAPNGIWTITPLTPLADGQVLAATATDRAGNASLTVSATVDAAAPAAPTIAPTNGIVLTGTADVGATVALADANGAAIGTVVANGAGVWTFVPATALANGVTVTAVASDAAGNASVPASTIVDAIAPSAPMIDPGNGIVLTGTGEAGATIVITDDNGGVIGQTLIDANGNWSLTPVTPIADGTIVIATATDAAGNISPPVAIETDAIAPGAVSILASMGTTFAGMAEAGALITLTDSNGAAIGQTIVDANGDWSLTAATPVADGTLVNATATDAAGNVSTPASIIVDAVAPAAPAIAASNGATLTGTAEAGSTIVLTNAAGTVIGTTVTDSGGAWAFTPSPAIVNGAVVTATAADSSGNLSLPASVTIDTIAPATPTIAASDGTILSGTAEAGTTLILTESGGQPIGTTVVDGNGNWSFTPAAPLADDTIVNAVARDAAGNTSGAATIDAPDLGTPTLTIVEAADGFINNAEIANGIQVNVALSPGADPGDTVTVRFTGPSGYVADQTHIVTVADRIAGGFDLTLTPPQGLGAYPEGSATVAAFIGAGPLSAPVAFTVDTIAPQTPVLSLLANILTISGEPNSTLTVDIGLAGTTANAVVTADNTGLASLDLLADLNVGLSWNDLLAAQVSVRGSDIAGNESNIATVGVGTGIQPIVLDNFGLAVTLIPTTAGFSGHTDPGTTLRAEIVTPVTTVVVAPPVDSAGDFQVNLLGALGLTLSGLLNLGAGVSVNLIATDATGHDSARYGVALISDGLSLNLGQVTITGDAGVNILSGTNGTSEIFNAGAGADLILKVGTGDIVNAGDGNDTIELTAINHGAISGGTGLDTILFADGIDINYNPVGASTWTSVERIDLGTGDSGSVLTLTSAGVNAVTDAGHVLQITGEANDTLNVVGAVDTGTDVTIGGSVYDVYTFGTATLQIEHNSVTVVH